MCFKVDVNNGAQSQGYQNVSQQQYLQSNNAHW